MSVIKSLSVGHGDMFYIIHNTDNFSIIDCGLVFDRREAIVKEIIEKSKGKGITRFISTHPDGDHIQGLGYLDEKITLLNFYCVRNETTKSENTDDFKKYCELRDSDKAFYLSKGCERNWMNKSNGERQSSGIDILWPDIENEYYKEALLLAKDGGSPNNISTIIKYSLDEGVTALWMGDLDSEFMDNISDELKLSKVNILFAPHHGRHSGTIPDSLLDDLDPDIIIIGEADSEHLNYYDGYKTITQNSAGDITLDCIKGKVHIYVGSKTYSVNYLNNESKRDFDNYIGTLNL